MVRIGIVGVGFMGMIHYLASKKLRGAQVTAIATRDPKKRAGDWTSIQGNFGPRGGNEDLTNVKCYTDAEELIADPNIDLVDICLPNHQHASVAIAALKAGKHVLVEKAIALTLDEADQMLAASKTTGKILQVAHVLPFFPDFRFALEAIESGRYGKLQAAHFRRHISPPDWSAAMADAQKTGGPLVDLHIHDTHFVGLACGTPTAVESRGVRRGGVLEYVSTHYLFGDNGPCVSATSGALSNSARPFTHGYEVYLEKATLYYEAGGALTVFREAGAEKPDLGAGDPIDAFTHEIQTAVNALSTGLSAPWLDARLARNALALCLKEQESALAGKPVAVG